MIKKSRAFIETRTLLLEKGDQRMLMGANLPEIILASTALYLLGIRGILSLAQSLIMRGEVS